MNTMKYLWLGIIPLQARLFASEGPLLAKPNTVITEQETAKPSYWGFTPGYHLDLGILDIKTDVADEVNKSGGFASMGTYALRREGKHHLQLGLGFTYAQVEGQSDARGIKQSLSVLGTYADCGWSYQLTPRLFMASYLRTVIGKGAWFDDGATRLDLGLNLMPALEFLWDKQSAQRRFQLAFARSINNPDRVVHSMLLGFSMTFDRMEIPVESRTSTRVDGNRLEVQSKAPIAPQGRPGPAEMPTKMRLADHLAIQFSPGSADISAEAQEVLSALAKILFRYKTAWQRVNFIAYQQPKEGRDQKLLEARVRSVSTYLEAEGVPRNRLRTKFQVSPVPVLESDSTQIQQNQVEIELQDMQGRDYWELRQALESLRTSRNNKIP